jgi:peroxiredoxin Q/BCP
MADQQAFTDKNNLPFPLWSDTELKLIKALGIEIAGRKLPQRVTFVVDKEGKIVKVYDKVSPDKHAKEVVAYVKELAAKK